MKVSINHVQLLALVLQLSKGVRCKLLRPLRSLHIGSQSI